MDKINRHFVSTNSIYVYILTVLVLPVLVLSLSSCSKGGRYQFKDAWLPEKSKIAAENTFMIAHAMGGIDKHTYTNSREAMELAYQNGFRVFEGDMMFLDGKIAFIHEKEDFVQMCGLDSDDISYEAYCSSKMYDRYTPLTTSSLLSYMQEHPDMYFMTDIKWEKPEDVYVMLSQLVQEAQAIDPSLPDRFIVQIYLQEMLDPVMEIYPFSSVLYTLYRSGDSFEQVIDFCKKSGIQIVTAPPHILTSASISELSKNGIRCLTHTVNTPLDWAWYLSIGVSGIYTDFLSPADMPHFP